MKLLLSFIAGIMCFANAVSAQTNPTLVAAYQNEKNAIRFHWEHTDSRIKQYILQRSSDNNYFIDVYQVDGASIEVNDFFNYTDQNVGAGRNYYRLKMIRNTEGYETTIPVMVIVGNKGGDWTIYPVPVTSMLTLQYNGTQIIPGVITVIIESVSSGTIFTRLRLSSNTRLIRIPVGHIGRGIYDIRIYVQDKVVWNQRITK